MKTKGGSTKAATLFVSALVVGALAFSGSALGATTNTAVTKPHVIIGDSNEQAGDVTIEEAGAGQLSDAGAQNTFTLALPEHGVVFSGRPTCTVTSGDLAITRNAPLSTSMRKVWDITSASTAASTITCNGIEYNVGGSVPTGDIDLEITSEPPANPGLTPGTVANAEAVEAGTTNEVVGTAAKVKIGGTSQAASDITITETAPGVLLTATSTITLTLPTGVTFNAAPTAVATGADGLDVGSAPGVSDQTASLNPSMDVATFHIVAESVGAADRLTISTAYDVDNSVAEGDVNIAIAGTSRVTPESLPNAEACFGGLTVKVLDFPVPSVTIGRDDQIVSDIEVKEFFGDDVNTTFDITLPTGLTWAETPSVASANGATVSASVASNVMTINYISQDGDGPDTITITGTGSIFVDAADTLPTGDITATVDNVTISGQPFSTTVKLGEAVLASIEVKPGEDPIMVGIGTTSNDMGTILVVEQTASSLSGSGSTVTITAPSGVTFGPAPFGNWDPASGLEVQNQAGGTAQATLNVSKEVATFQITKQSGTATTLMIGYFSPKGLNVASTVPEGNIVMQVGGTAGAFGDVVTNIAAAATRTSVSEVLPVTIGEFGQAVGDLLITENFAGAVQTGIFAVSVQTPGVTLTGDPDIMVVPSGALTAILQNPTSTGFEIAVSGAPTGTPATIMISDLLVNVGSGVADGTDIEFLLNDVVDDGAGIVSTIVTVGRAFAEPLGVEVALSPDPLILGPAEDRGVLTATVDVASPPPVPLDVTFAEVTDPDGAIDLYNMRKLDDDGKAAVMVTGVTAGTTTLNLFAIDHLGGPVADSVCVGSDPLDPEVATLASSVLTIFTAGATELEATCLDSGSNPVSGYLITGTRNKNIAITDVQPQTDTAGQARTLVQAVISDSADHTAIVSATAEGVSDTAMVNVLGGPPVCPPETTIEVQSVSGMPGETGITVDVVTSEPIFVGSTDLVISYDPDTLAAIYVTSSTLAVLDYFIDDEEGTVAVLTIDPAGVVLGSGDTLISVTFSVDHGASPGSTVMCPSDLDGYFDFDEPVPPFPTGKVCWEPECGVFVIGLGDLDCDDRFTGADVLVQASLVVDLLECEDLPFCIASCSDVGERSDWDCTGSINGADVLIGASIIVGRITQADTPLGQGCP